MYDSHNMRRKIYRCLNSFSSKASRNLEVINLLTLLPLKYNILVLYMIVNPIDGKKYQVTSNIGRGILKKYLNTYKSGGSSGVDQWPWNEDDYFVSERREEDDRKITAIVELDQRMRQNRAPNLTESWIRNFFNDLDLLVNRYAHKTHRSTIDESEFETWGRERMTVTQMRDWMKNNLDYLKNYIKGQKKTAIQVLIELNDDYKIDRIRELERLLNNKDEEIRELENLHQLMLRACSPSSSAG